MAALQSTVLAFGIAFAVASLTPGGDAVAKPREPSAIEQTTPFAQKVFCLRNPDACRNRAAGQNVGVTDGRVVLDAQRLAELERVNLAVNRRMKPQAEKTGLDRWQADSKTGDCEDYVLAKQQMLSELGWPSSSTLMARVRTSRGELHAVLLARTDKSTFMLDNLSDSPRPVKEASYVWISVQSPDDPMKWQAASGVI